MNDLPVKRGDRVLLMQARHMASLKHRRLPVFGRVTRRDGGYIYVRPSWCRWATECYENEVVLANGPVALTDLMTACGGSYRPRGGPTVGFA